METLVECRELTVKFGGLLAVQDVDLAVAKGEIRAVIGPNGAGKTTLINALTGVYSPSSGKIFFKDREISGYTPHAIVMMGIARTFQNIRLFRELSVLENVMVGCHCRTRSWLIGVVLGTGSARKEERDIRRRAEEALEFVGLQDRGDIVARGLPYGQQRLLEIARALATEPDLLLLDEPAAGMNATECVALIQRVRRIRDKGITLILVEHNMRLVMSIADQVTVLDFGKKIAEGTPDQVRNDPAIIEAYLGAKEDATH